MDLKDLFQAFDRVPNVSATDQTLYSEFVKAGKSVEVEIFVAGDLTTANKTITLGVERLNIKYPLYIAAAGASGYSILLSRPVTIVSGERLYATIASCTLNDAIFIFARGKYL